MRPLSIARRLTIVALFTGIAVATTAARAHAQGSAAPSLVDQPGDTASPPPRSASDASNACLRDLPPSAFFRVPVYLSVGEWEVEARLLRNDAAYLAQRVATRARALLGAHPDTLPVAEPRVTWESDEGSVVVTVHRGGAVTWRIGTPGHWRRDSSSVPMSDSAAAAWTQRHRGSLSLLEQAMRAEIAAEAPFFVWPDVARADSLHFSLRLVHEHVNRAGKVIEPLLLRPLFPLFTLATPWSEPVVERSAGIVRYPEIARQNGVRGSVLLQFVVDTLGRVERSSVRDLRRAAITAESSGAFHLAFVDAARTGVQTARYSPARLGGCAVRQVVQRPFVFEMAN